MSPIRFFARSQMSTECEACQARFDLMNGGVCEQCKRILCYTHLHGSWLRRLGTDFGTRPICVACRAAS